jgi:hypothetical protein
MDNDSGKNDSPPKGLRAGARCQVVGGTHKGKAGRRELRKLDQGAG